MSSRPEPPMSTDVPEELAAHVAQDPSAWLLYLRNLNVHLSSAEEEISSLRTTMSEQARALREREDLLREYKGVIGYQKELLEAAQRKHTQLEIEKARLLDAATPAVRTPPTEPAACPADATVATAPRASTPTPVTNTGSAHLSEKLPDPKEFDGTRGDLRRFTQQVYAKMTANADRFPTATARLTYVAGRLTGKAYELVLPKTCYGIPQFVDYPALLEYLERAFGDPDRVQNAQNKLYSLRQRNLDFSVYFSEFQRLALEGEMTEDALTPLLFQGISRELQDMLLHNPSPTRKFLDYANHLQTLDNRYRQHQQQVSRNRNATQTPSAAARASPNQPKTTPSSPISVRPATPTALGDPMDLSSQRQGHGRKERRECYRCGSKAHFVANCPEPDKRPPRLQGLRSSSPIQSPLARSPTRSVVRSPDRGRSTSPAQSSVNGVSLN